VAFFELPRIPLHHHINCLSYYSYRLKIHQNTNTSTLRKPVITNELIRTFRDDYRVGKKQELRQETMK